MTYTNPQLLTSAAELKEILSNSPADNQVFDCTVLMHPEPKGYRVESVVKSFAKQRIQGAHYLDLRGQLRDATSKFGFTRPQPDQLELALQAAGIHRETHVFLYSRTHIMWSTRVWWLLHTAGLHNVTVLNGGFRAWKAEAGPISSGAFTPPVTGNIKIKHDATRWAPLEEVIDAVNNKGASTICALPAEAYAGTSDENYGRAGHIPGSVNVPYDEVVDANGHFRDADALRAAFAERGIDGSKRTISYCGGGIAATVDAFALSLLGYGDVAVFDGSMSEWSLDESLPVTTGSAP